MNVETKLPSAVPSERLVDENESGECPMSGCPRKPLLLTLIQAGRAAEERLEAALAQVGLSGAKFAALSALVNASGPLSLSDLATRLTCVRSNVTQLVDRLEADGLVIRLDDPKDRRTIKAALTHLGRARHTAGEECAQQVFTDLERQLTDADRTALTRLFATLK
jgi:DNA-binding MarR family transcriptional regulator